MNFNSPANLDLGDLTREDILEFVTKFIDRHGYSPSFREIANGCELFSTGTVHHHVNVLRAMGKIEYQDHIARSIRVLEAA